MIKSILTIAAVCLLSAPAFGADRPAYNNHVVSPLKLGPRIGDTSRFVTTFVCGDPTEGGADLCLQTQVTVTKGSDELTMGARINPKVGAAYPKISQAFIITVGDNNTDFIVTIKTPEGVRKPVAVRKGMMTIVTRQSIDGGVTWTNPTPKYVRV